MTEDDQKRAAKILKPYRKQINDIDDRILKLLTRRFGVVRKVAGIKTKHGLPSFLHDRVEAVRNRCVAMAEKQGLDPQFVYALYSAIIYRSCALEDEIKSELLKKKKK
ncbi:MAG: chorismate mutase [Alphaproteobacteria bacterium]|nr:chorismate mutase [Alphaproteobacteria bacterium]